MKKIEKTSRKFFNQINAKEFTRYMQLLTADAMRGSKNKNINGMRVDMMIVTIDFVNKLDSLINKDQS